MYIKLKKSMTRYNAAFPLETFSENDLDVSGKTEGIHAEYQHSSFVWISFSNFNNRFNLINIITIPISPLMTVYWT